MDLSSFFPESYNCVYLKSNTFVDHIQNLDIPVIILFLGNLIEPLFLTKSMQVCLWLIKLLSAINNANKNKKR